MKDLYPWHKDAWRNLLGLKTRLPHALLIKGAKGVGKLDLAMNFAQSMLCRAPLASGMPCVECDSCHWFDQGTHPDFRLIQPDSLSLLEDGVEKEGGKKPSREISVDQIRALGSFSNLSAHQGGYRIVLIHPAESMNNNSANALLKTLEEPTSNLLFVLVTHQPQQLLPTILSRCLSLTVNTPGQEVGVAWLEQQRVVNPGKVLAQAGGSPLRAWQSMEAGEGAEELDLLLLALQRPQQIEPLMLADKLQRTAPGQVVHGLQQWCYDLTSAKQTGRVRYFPDQLALLKKLSLAAPIMNLLRLQKELQAAKRAAFHPLNPKLQLEAILLSYQQAFIDQRGQR